MESSEIEKELSLSYSELVKYLLEKYGPSEYDYFLTESCKTKNPKVSRSSEGLECHHIDEDKAIMLSTTSFAINNPFDYQKAERLVYCNTLEHLILHIKIVEEPRNEKANPLELPGVGGAVNFICPQINDYYDGYCFKKPYLVKRFELISTNFDDYIDVLNYFLTVVAKLRPELMLKVTREKLSTSSIDGHIIGKIYERLKQ